MAVGQVFYTPWCDEDGKVIDDGTLAHLDDGTWRWTATYSANGKTITARQEAAMRNNQITALADSRALCQGLFPGNRDATSGRRP